VELDGDSVGCVTAVVAAGANGILKGSPEACKACTIAFQPFSRVLILSLSSSFSRSIDDSLFKKASFCSSDSAS